MPKRVLVVDDDPSIVQLIRLNLKMEGYDVNVAYDGRTALTTALQELPDLIILDIMMPGLNGREVLTLLKQNPRTANIPVLMLTALSDAKEITESLMHGAEWHLTKPFEMHELTEMVTRLIAVGEEGSLA